MCIYKMKVSVSLFCYFLYFLAEVNVNAKEDFQINCYQCIQIDPNCISGHECEEEREFAEKELNSKYYFGDSLQYCPDHSNWEIKGKNECPPKAKCGVGTLRFEKSDNNGNYNTTAYAKILGCIKYPFLEEINEFEKKKDCFFSTIETVYETHSMSMNLKQCLIDGDSCNSNYCINENKTGMDVSSIDKSFDGKNPRKNNSSLNSSTGIFIGVSIIFSILILGLFGIILFLWNKTKDQKNEIEELKRNEPNEPLIAMNEFARNSSDE